ncbi:Hemin import ATP-binding protein HmuV [Micromonospora noduli]|uniref:Hemin import ATP-binding protein HmuV n=1 Tax=Micromonospora noduli TaxID=709876 RepID=A0A328N7F7_9ACTN|nr:ATP-binding cassette domain-containing protein [Micromonospora noduli]RAN99228.1 Hemin import ATP-binding protein HmuV [Micromonospora noduli]RAO12146.1 Hemin import ATP-binding protein HmuV [Micromonospora noduli]RAO36636.1 Hemin import ATP-binding protein HmuV [Micromonospora noduli]
MTTEQTTSPPRAGVGIAAQGLGQSVRSGRQILTDISLSIAPGELVAIIGASGAGKTTLLEILAGVQRPAAGTVTYDGSAAAGTIGVVPQDDIIHRELPLARTLRYAARLRLPSSTGPAEISDRVAEVLAELRLTDRAATPVGLLSGGERKRASIAVELLTRPGVFFLDEPTSGLDPAIAVELLRVLRALADTGATVVLTTHQITDVDHCDRVVVLTRQGRLAFTGTPAAAREFFGLRSLVEVHLRLDEVTQPAEWPDRFAEQRPAEQPPRTTDDADVAATPARRVGRLRQWEVLTARNTEIVARNRLTLAILLGSPLMVLGMFALLFRPGAFEPTRPSPTVTVMILFWIAFGGFFFGLTYGLLQICTELPILRRERLAGVRLIPYLLAKVAVLLPLLALVDLALLGVLRGMDRLPPVGGADFAALYATLLLSSAAALALGLLCSAAVSDAAQATLMLPMLCFPQVLFVGAILPVPAMAVGGQWLSYAMSNRWAFEGLGHTAGVERLWRDGGSPLGPPLLATYGDSFSRPVWVDWLVLGGFVLLFLSAAWAVLLRRDPRRAS